MKSNSLQPVFQLTRGSTVESIHFGAVAVVDSHGALVASCGSPETITFLRSTAKPFQALPFVESGGPQAFHFLEAEIALICASHSGTDLHARTAASIQAKAGFTEADLLCGVHTPFHKPTAEALASRGEEPTPNRHNCSGKHSGMLAFARYKNWPLEDYINPDHPVQKSILRTFAEMCSLEPEAVRVGTDGCSAPNFAVPLYNTALAFARLSDPGDLSPDRKQACQTIFQAMTTHPEMVGGPGRFDTRLMETTGGRLVSKGGAEGYQGIGLLPGASGEAFPGLGIAIKISDGDARRRARSAVTLEVLRQLGALAPDELRELDDFGPVFPVYNWRKLVVGEGRPCFQLTRHPGELS